MLEERLFSEPPDAYTLVPDLCQEKLNLKALSVIRNPNFTFFRTFLYFQRELHCNRLPIQQCSWKHRVLGKRDHSLLLGINFRRRKLIQASFSSNKSFKF